MAEEWQVSPSAERKQTQINELTMSVNCSDCVLVKEQLLAALQELKSAETIISLLREDMKRK